MSPVRDTLRNAADTAGAVARETGRQTRALFLGPLEHRYAPEDRAIMNIKDPGPAPDTRRTAPTVPADWYRDYRNRARKDYRRGGTKR